ncbi:energy transducer TonB [Oceanospirillum maris]|uniref:energy transducer TonB n=1 Tax=Oceanospirillum maris TaxID=64977 RepID=UPI00042A484C|nr:energy transducer TonB [Oceanospirillum maris]
MPHNVQNFSLGKGRRLRAFAVVPIGVLLTLVFFVLLAQMVQMDQMRELPEDNSSALSLFMLQDETELELRSRARPEPPEPPEPQPEMPTMSQPVSNPEAMTAMATPDVALPDVALESSFQLDVDISQFQPGDTGLEIAENPMPLSRVNPRYPRKAIRRGLEGEVLLEFTVDANGDVVTDSIKIISATPEGVFDRASVRALARWRFQPRKQGGKALPFRARQTLVFKLSN